MNKTDKADLSASRLALKAAQAQFTAQVKEIFLKAAKSLFSDNPALTSFGWQQYTPYFNDGDTCRFQTLVKYPTINGINSNYDILEKPEDKELTKVVTKFLNGFETEDFLSMFGDHVSINVTPKGIEVEAYEHD